MKINTKEITLVALFAGLTAVGAFISLPLGPVPITLQTIFVLLSGILLGAKLGALSQIVYIALGLIGVPIFSGFTGGPQSVLKPSFGFIIGFVFAAFIVGKIAENNSQFTIHNSQFEKENSQITTHSSQLTRDNHPATGGTMSTYKGSRIWMASIVGTIVIYLFGIPYMYYILNVVMSKGLSLDAILKMGLWMFIPGDILKLIIVSILGIKIKPILKLSSRVYPL